jgi:DNA mismatch repair protein MutS2
VGDRVRVVRLGAVGEISAIDGDEIEVRAGVMTVRVARGDLERAPSPTTDTETAARGGARGGRSGRGGARGGVVDHAAAANDGSIEGALRVPANTLDLRGVRVEEALARLESFLDRAMLESRDVVFVLHGHGTGALKDAIRRALATSPYVSAAGAASDDQGGDAFTAARLRG